MTFEEKLVSIVPSARQLDFQQTEFYAFIHFGMNTFTDREWGDGTEKENLFNPRKLDANQWVEAVKAAGMKGLILTCKHHDGFCLWPSRYTEHSVKNSPWKNGAGDVVREVSEACKKGGIKFGVYLSPWDRNNEAYGYGDAYNDYFVNQLTELLTGYGDIFCVWFDGACGEGSNGKKQTYDWERYYEVIRRLQPGACINVCGPDIRWCGNEAGDTRPSEWSVVPKRTQDTERIKEASQQADNEEFRARKITASDRDLGSREILKNEEALVWYPAEVNTSIRPGWFYHSQEDDRVRSLSELTNIYRLSVGGNATFLLNLPPTPDGLIHENDVKRLREIGKWLEDNYGNNLLPKAGIISKQSKKGFEAENLREDDYDHFFMTEAGEEKAVIEIEFNEPVTVHGIVLKENIKMGQRIEKFSILAGDASEMKTVYEGTVVGYKRIAEFDEIKVTKLNVVIEESRVCPTLSFVGVY